MYQCKIRFHKGIITGGGKALFFYENGKERGFITKDKNKKWAVFHYGRHKFDTRTVHVYTTLKQAKESV